MPDIVERLKKLSHALFKDEKEATALRRERDALVGVLNEILDNWDKDLATEPYDGLLERAAKLVNSPATKSEREADVRPEQVDDRLA